MATGLKIQIVNAVKKLDNFSQNWQEEFEIHKQQSFEWFQGLIKKIKGEIDEIRDVTLTRQSIGSFYGFFYKSKLYEQGKLAFYDYAPLDLILSQDSKYFIGINFHYIHPLVRAKVLKKLILYYQGQWFDDKPLLPITYKKFNSILGDTKRYVNFSIKKYIKKRIVRTNGLLVKRIKPEDMVQSVSLLGPQWKGTSNKEALDMIKSINFNLTAPYQANKYLLEKK